MNYKYNEKEYGRIIKEKGFQSKFLRYELVVLVKYLKQIENLTKKETEEFLYEFCEKYIENFNKVIYYKTIDGAIRDGRKRKNKLIVVESISITNKELNYIDSLDLDQQYKKLLLSFLVKRKISYEINKLSNDESELSAYFNGTKKTFREIFKHADISVRGYKIDEMINELVKKDIIESIINGDIVLSYMYDIYKTKNKIEAKKDNLTQEIKKIKRKHIIYELDEKDIFYKLKDFNNIGYVFDYYKGENRVKKCEECGELIKAKSKKPPKYCKECAKKKQKEWEKNSKNKAKIKNGKV